MTFTFSYMHFPKVERERKTKVCFINDTAQSLKAYDRVDPKYNVYDRGTKFKLLV